MQSESEDSSLEEEIEEIGISRRYLKDNENHFEIYNEHQFQERYKFTKECVFYILLPIIYNRINITGGHAISVIKKLLISLRYYASNCFQLVNGDLRKISQPSVSRIVMQISRIFAAELSNYIAFPNTPEEITRSIEDFDSIADFPNVIGAIDCTHIMIKNPGGSYGETFRNRKGWFSLNVQVVGDSNLAIKDIVIRHPGSAHDALIFDRSALRARFERNEISGILLGDGGYPNRPYILTPVINPITNAEKKYNAAHIKTRNTIERLFGVWKRKFPCLQSCLRTNLMTSVATIAAVAVLYNISIKYNQNIDYDYDFDYESNVFDEAINDDLYEDDEMEDDDDVQTGLQFRNDFINNFFN